MPEDLIRYDVLAQEALRGVVRKVLQEIAQTGLPGEHHFFITFDTRNPAVRMSSRLRSLYPEEMTIVLQHQFWDLTVSDTGLEVGLSFNGIPERLQVPYRAITAFVDPHASFGLKFDVGDEGALSPDLGAAEDEEAGTGAGESDDPASASAPAREGRRLSIAGDLSAEEPAPAGNDDDETEAETSADEASQADTAENAPTERPDEGAEVVSLDAFRKKNG